ncbi:MAG: ceramidase domain-containing protein [Haliea sp.]|nr:ceramidase domain-containing protein [Haliea sp.]
MRQPNSSAHPISNGETTVCSWISEPANTWSNALYLVFAFVIYVQCRKSPHLELRWMGPAMFFMGLFSLVYHASNNYVTQVFDFIGMYLLVFWFWSSTCDAAVLLHVLRRSRFGCC